MPQRDEDLQRRNELQKEVEHLRRNLMHEVIYQHSIQ